MLGGVFVQSYIIISTLCFRLFCFLIFDIGQKKAKHRVGTCFGISFGFLAAVIISGNVARGAHRIRLFDLAG